MEKKKEGKQTCQPTVAVETLLKKELIQLANTGTLYLKACSDGVSVCLNQDKETKMSQRQLNTMLPH